MFIADETHTKIMNAGAGLADVRKALAEAKWAAAGLRFMLNCADMGDLDPVVAMAQKNSERIGGMAAKLEAAEKALDEAASALEFARSKIPNTTPPHPAGFESFTPGDGDLGR